MKLKCIQCGEVFDFDKEDTRWDYRGFGYDTRLTQCPSCGQLNIVEYYEEPDRTGWYYGYRRKEN